MALSFPGRVRNNISTVQSISDIGIMVRVFASGPGDLGSIPGRVIPKTRKKKSTCTTLLNTEHYKA